MATLRFNIHGAPLLGSRYTAKHFREQIEEALQAGDQQIVLDFSGIASVTDSFTDELLGTLLATADREILPLLRFKGCTQAVRTAIETLLAEVVGRRATSA
jgi:anti-anti-sigma regulatory factor